MKLWLTNFINGRVHIWPSSPPNPLKICVLYPASRDIPTPATASSGGEGHRKGTAWGPSLWAHVAQEGDPRNPDRACESTGIQSNPPNNDVDTECPELPAICRSWHHHPCSCLEKGPHSGRTGFPRYKSSRPRQNSSISSTCGTHNLLQASQTLKREKI